MDVYGCTAESFIWVTTWNFSWHNFRQRFFRVRQILALVLVLLGENRLPGYFLFLFTFWNHRANITVVSTTVCQEMEDQNGNFPSLIQRTTIAYFTFFVHTQWLSTVLCLAKIQNRIFLMETEFVINLRLVGVFFK